MPRDNRRFVRIFGQMSLLVWLAWIPYRLGITLLGPYLEPFFWWPWVLLVSGTVLTLFSLGAPVACLAFAAIDWYTRAWNDH